MLIYLDVDGPLGCLQSASRDLFPPGTAPTNQWDFLSPLSREEQARVKSFWRKKGFARSIPPQTGAVEAVRMLRERAHQVGVYVQLLTAPLSKAPYWREDRIEWARHHFGFDPQDVIFADDKRPYPGATLVDDRLDNCEGWMKAQGRPAWLFDPHGEHPHYPHRIGGWGGEAVEKLIETALQTRRR